MVDIMKKRDMFVAFEGVLMSAREPRVFGFVQYFNPGDAADEKYYMDGQDARPMTLWSYQLPPRSPQGTAKHPPFSLPVASPPGGLQHLYLINMEYTRGRSNCSKQ
ncbi:unnamed protein product [Triticum turgidum subsp. durum]|uniref:Uncharacterized protein n=1 Tax=Triticum turgidum subsp. durum TaxID=4567 RepID=A0A9R0WAR2_TRITD|nr:unnamed protein product [Triticum turgidum subsp. durum]